MIVNRIKQWEMKIKAIKKGSRGESKGWNPNQNQSLNEVSILAKFKRKTPMPNQKL